MRKKKFLRGKQHSSDLQVHISEYRGVADERDQSTTGYASVLQKVGDESTTPAQDGGRKLRNGQKNRWNLKHVFKIFSTGRTLQISRTSMSRDPSCTVGAKPNANRGESLCKKTSSGGIWSISEDHHTQVSRTSDFKMENQHLK